LTGVPFTLDELLEHLGYSRHEHQEQWAELKNAVWEQLRLVVPDGTLERVSGDLILILREPELRDLKDIPDFINLGDLRSSKGVAGAGESEATRPGDAARSSDGDPPA
jgi:hypothetical protein